MKITPIMTSRFTSEELYEIALDVVEHNNMIIDDEDRLFQVSSTKAFYMDKNKDLFLMEIEDGSGKALIEIKPEQVKAMFVLYECVADALKLEKE